MMQGMAAAAPGERAEEELQRVIVSSFDRMALPLSFHTQRIARGAVGGYFRQSMKICVSLGALDEIDGLAMV